MSAADAERAKVRRLVAVGLGRAFGLMVVLVGLYFLLPLGALAHTVSWGVVFAGFMLILTATAVVQLRAVLGSPIPAIRAIEGVAATVPVFVLMFAATYYVTAESTHGTFSTTLTRVDALYFAVTVFATVGFGDITATAETARMVVTVQMVLDLIVLGAGARVFIGAIRLGRERGESTRHVAFNGSESGRASHGPESSEDAGGPIPG